MAKFIKSIFSPNEKPKGHYEGSEEERKASPPPDGRRQLSISRSGRMRQANKKRHSLTLQLYGDNEDIDIEVVEKPKTMEYHVHTPVCHTAPAEMTSNARRCSTDDPVTEITESIEETLVISSSFENNLEDKFKKIADGQKSPEEEIDNAFEIIDKS